MTKYTAEQVESVEKTVPSPSEGIVRQMLRAFATILREREQALPVSVPDDALQAAQAVLVDGNERHILTDAACLAALKAAFSTTPSAPTAPASSANSDDASDADNKDA